jgi:hypothetical protein
MSSQDSFANTRQAATIPIQSSGVVIAINEQAEATFAALNEHQLKTCLLNIWERFERTTLRDEFAPLLYHLRLKLRAPGREGQGFEKWVGDNLGIAIRTANRWATWYEERLGVQRPPKQKLKSLGHVADTLPEETSERETSDVCEESSGSSGSEPSPDDAHPVSLQLILTTAQKAEWVDAFGKLTPDESTTVIFEAVITAAAKRESMLTAGVVQ